MGGKCEGREKQYLWYCVYSEDRFIDFVYRINNLELSL